MDEQSLKELLEAVRNGSTAVPQALAKLKHWPAEEMEMAVLDHHRSLRCGMPEVVYGEHKDAGQIVAILNRMLTAAVKRILVTRVAVEKARQIQEHFPELHYHQQARIVSGPQDWYTAQEHRGEIVIICAGTSDIPVAEEAAVTCRCLGHPCSTIYDVGVAGLHRLFACQDALQRAKVVIVVAGMEGALPSVIGGLVDKPIVAVPTSIGYGTGFGGIAALLGMLNSCAPGVSVVNIDNGFGAACVAAAINRP